MAIEKAKEFFRERGMEDRVLEFDASSATVELAAAGGGLRAGAHRQDAFVRVWAGRVALVVAAGDARVDNQQVQGRLPREGQDARGGRGRGARRARRGRRVPLRR